MSLLKEAVKRNNFQDVHELIANGIDINEVSKALQQTLLHLAAGLGHDQIAELLISNGANIDAKDLKGSTPLHYAVGHNRIKTVKSLIENGANIHALTSLEVTPLDLAVSLELAVFKCRTDIIRLLIENGADVNKILHNAIVNQKIKIMECLLKAGVSVDTIIGDQSDKSIIVHNLLSLAIALKNTEMIEFLLKNGARLKNL